jgi:FAD:protein FMN transferase
MISSCAPTSSIKRARPWLGTIVEITAGGSCESSILQAIEEAFASVRKVHRLMNFHDPESELSHLNRRAFYEPVLADAWTYEVLQQCHRFSSLSNGVFDATASASDPAKESASWKDVQLHLDGTVQFLHPLTMNLSGIAKGYAVDRAVLALQDCGMESGIVNAGGDLRVFGPVPHVIHLRDPSAPSRMAGSLSLEESALATSASYFQIGQSPHLCDGQTKSRCLPGGSVTVKAADCTTADALCKIVAAMGSEAASLLWQENAEAIIFNETPQFIP